MVAICLGRPGVHSSLREELRAYLERTGVSARDFGDRACNATGCAVNFLNGGTIRDKTALRIRKALDLYPDGFTIKRSKDYGAPPDPVAVPAISRDSCTRCGVRGELGCSHRKPLEIQKELKP